MSVQNATPRLTLRDLQTLYARGEKLTVLTAYDYVMGGLLDQAGLEMILVGDSLGNVVLGYETTIPVTLADILRHTAAVVRGTGRAFVIADLPFGTVRDEKSAVDSAIQALQNTGCQAVKLEGGTPMAPIVRKITEQGIPVMGHIGLTPQSVHQLGGFYRHGKTEEDIQRLKQSAHDLQEAGAFSIVLECLVPEIATEITRDLKIPTIGIGSGGGCSGQVLVVNDLLGLGLKPGPKFATPRADLASIIRTAAREYVAEVKGVSR